MRRVSKYSLVALVAGSLFSSAVGAQQPASNAGGTWDMTWQTRKGPSKRGYMVIAQSGASIDAQIYGQGSVRAKGQLFGTTFVLHGSRMAVPYTISGHLDGDAMSGALKILAIERQFTAARRRP